MDLNDFPWTFWQGGGFQFPSVIGLIQDEDLVINLIGFNNHVTSYQCSP